MRTLSDQAEEDFDIALEIVSKANAHGARITGKPKPAPITVEEAIEAMELYREAQEYGLRGLAQITVAASIAVLIGLRSLGYRIEKIK
mgnify:CR=1 FL=1